MLRRPVDASSYSAQMAFADSMYMRFLAGNPKLIFCSREASRNIRDIARLASNNRLLNGDR